MPLVIKDVLRLGVQAHLGVVVLVYLMAVAVQLVQVRVIFRERANDIMRNILFSRAVPDTLGPHRLLHQIRLGFHSILTAF